MNLSPSLFLKAKEFLERANRIIILSHKNPDGDTVGANLALRRVLKTQMWKDVVSACIDPPPENSDFLPEVKTYVQDFHLEDFDLVVTVDCGAHYMVKFHETKPKLFSGNPPVINIDHHASNDHFGTVNIVDPDAASATLVLFHLLEFLKYKIDPLTATCLLHGLYYDTGSFMHSNVTPEVLKTASNLLWRGADFKTIVKKQFRTISLPQLKLYGRILERIRTNGRQLIVSALSGNDFQEVGANQDDSTGAIDFLNSIPDGKLCCLLTEDSKGFIKGSFRTRDSIDLSELARIFGGGGHKKAAGFSFPGRLSELDERIKIIG